VHTARPVRTYCREEIPPAKTHKSILKFAAVPSEENSPGPWAVTKPKDIAFFERRPKLGGSEGVVVGLFTA